MNTNLHHQSYSEMVNREAMEVCAECETSRAQVHCLTESLLYCIPCSNNLHSKKARSHHHIVPIIATTNIPKNSENTDPKQNPNPKTQKKPPSQKDGKKPLKDGEKKPLKDTNKNESLGDGINGLEKEFRLKCRLSGKGQRKGSVTVEAFVVKGDDEEEGVDSNDEGVRLPSDYESNESIKDRIRKILDLWLHPDTPEHEAQQALKNAQRLLTKHNLKQAEVMAGDCKKSEALAGGMCVVELISTKNKTKPGNVGQWASHLATAIAKNFDTQYFRRRYVAKDGPLQIVFYGIKQNAECAGFAYAATFNRIIVMSARYKPEKSCPREEVKKDTGTATLVARNNYRRGIVAGLLKAVEDGKDQQASETMSVLVLLSKQVGDDIIKKNGIKIKNKQPTKNIMFNREAYAQGVTDSKQIDINQKGLPHSDQTNQPEIEGLLN